MNFDAPLPPWWRDIFRLTDPVHKSVKETVLASGDSGLRVLAAVFQRELGELPVPRPSQVAPYFAAHLFSDFARPELGPWLLDLMQRLGGDDPLTEILGQAVAACGPEVVAETCARFAATEPGDPLRPWLAEAVAAGGARSPEALAVLIRHLEDDPMHGAQLVADYGDAAAVPALLAVFDSTTDEDAIIVATLGEAVRALGGELDAPRAARLATNDADARATRLRRRREMIARSGFSDAVPKPEPQDPCPCESGRDYASCCAAIEADLVERLALQMKWPS